MTEEQLTPVQTLEEKIRMIEIQAEGVRSNITIQQELLEGLANQIWDYNQAIKILNESGMPSNIESSILADKIESNSKSDGTLSHFPFKESIIKRANLMKWSDSYNYGDVTVSKEEGFYKLSHNKNRVLTTFDYLKEFYAELSDSTSISQIGGINDKKASVLLKFYAAHPNFSCHIEYNNKKMFLVKDDEEIKLNQDTNGGEIAIEYDEGIND